MSGGTADQNAMARQPGGESIIKSQIAALEEKKSREGMTSAEKSRLYDLLRELVLRRYERDEEERQRNLESVESDVSQVRGVAVR